MYIHVYIHIYVCIYTYIHTYTYTQLVTGLSLSIGQVEHVPFVYMYTYIYICYMYTYTFIYVSIHIYTLTHTHTHTQLVTRLSLSFGQGEHIPIVCMYTYTYIYIICTHIHLYYMYTYTFIYVSIHIYTLTHTHTHTHSWSRGSRYPSAKENMFSSLATVAQARAHTPSNSCLTSQTLSYISSHEFPPAYSSSVCGTRKNTLLRGPLWKPPNSFLYLLPRTRPHELIIICIWHTQELAPTNSLFTSLSLSESLPLSHTQQTGQSSLALKIIFQNQY